jgi:hypothetical protein
VASDTATYAADMIEEQWAPDRPRPQGVSRASDRARDPDPVSIILDALADGMTESEIMPEYPTLTVAGIRAAATYGAELARDEYPAVTAT